MLHVGWAVKRIMCNEKEIIVALYPNYPLRITVS